MLRPCEDSLLLLEHKLQTRTRKLDPSVAFVTLSETEQSISKGYQ